MRARLPYVLDTHPQWTLHVNQMPLDAQIVFGLFAALVNASISMGCEFEGQVSVISLHKMI